MIRSQKNIMVRLKNIKRNNNIIECDIIPEDSEEYGHVVVNIETADVESFRLPKNFEWCTNHVYFAKKALLKMVDDNNLLEEKLVMWY